MEKTGTIVPFVFFEDGIIFYFLRPIGFLFPLKDVFLQIESVCRESPRFEVFIVQMCDRMKRLWLYLTILSLSVMTVESCASLRPERPSPPSAYADSSNWYSSERPVDEAFADVFYLMPTCVYDRIDSCGHVSRYATSDDPEHRRRMLRSCRDGERIFGDSVNFFAPLYGQISLDVWMDGDSAVERLFPKTMDDIRLAFDYYLHHLNNGRPFVLVGYSQGAKGVVELMKCMDPSAASRWVAAYVCGYKVTASDTVGHPLLRPALQKDDTRVVVVYNSVTDTAASNPMISNGGLWCINPVGWTTSTQPCWLNDSVSVSIDSSSRLLVVEGLDAASLFVPKFAHLFPLGNLHLQELKLYASLLRHNVQDRIRAFNLGR